MAQSNTDKNPDGLRVIKTARDIDTINKAVQKGYRPIIKKAKPSKEIRSKYAIFRNKKTGKIELLEDLRIDPRMNNDFEVIIDWTYYYPYSFKSPFAAYLVPNDIRKGERVYLKDLIEDLVGMHNKSQGDKYRLESCEAIWNGKDFNIQFNEKTDFEIAIG